MYLLCQITRNWWEYQVFGYIFQNYHPFRLTNVNKNIFCNYFRVQVEELFVNCYTRCLRSNFIRMVEPRNPCNLDLCHLSLFVRSKPKLNGKHIVKGVNLYLQNSGLNFVLQERNLRQKAQISMKYFSKFGNNCVNCLIFLVYRNLFSAEFLQHSSYYLSFYKVFPFLAL